MSWEPWLKFEPIETNKESDEFVHYQEYMDQEKYMERVLYSFRLPHELLDEKSNNLESVNSNW